VSTRDDDAAWQQIVDNYGERPDVPAADAPAVDTPVVDATPDTATDAPEPFHLGLYDEQFVPPPLPPPPVVTPDRRLAWVGLVVSPLLLVVLSLLDYALPTVLTGALVLAFLASFGYLVATMQPHDPDDDGARV
jgi:hypothetical protein